MSKKLIVSSRFNSFVPGRPNSFDEKIKFTYELSREDNINFQTQKIMWKQDRFEITVHRKKKVLTYTSTGKQKQPKPGNGEH